jgi:NifU-like protein involved in Fe-S cluster formation
MFGELYHSRVLELAADIPFSCRLEAPHGAATRVARICGSEVEVEVRLDAGRRISAIAVIPRACALGQAAASVLARSALGKTSVDIRQARDALAAMLRDGADPPGGDFWELRHLAPVHAYPPRHASTLLAFEAAVDAIASAEAHVDEQGRSE